MRFVFADLVSSLESAEVQRGVGTSTVGAAAFGGSVSFVSVALRNEPALLFEGGMGSFGLLRASVGGHSGTLPGGLQAYARIAHKACGS